MKLPSLRQALPVVALFLVFLAITLPATHVLGWLSGGGRLAAAGIEGTAWNGRAERLAVGGYTLGPVVWRWNPLPLFAGRLEYRVFAQSGAGGGELRLGRGLSGALSARDMQLTLPAAEVGRQLHVPLVTLDGDFQIDVAELVFAGGWVESLAGQIVWQGAQVLQPSPLPLGSLTMQLGLRDGNVVGTLGDQGGPLELGGEFTLGADRAYRLDALLKPRGDADPQLRQALGMLGNPDAQGRYRLRYSGAL